MRINCTGVSKHLKKVIKVCCSGDDTCKVNKDVTWSNYNPGMVIMEHKGDSPNVRKGRFLWMDRAEKERFIRDIKSKIEQGYYYSDLIFNKVADELAPVMADTIEE